MVDPKWYLDALDTGWQAVWQVLIPPALLLMSHRQTYVTDVSLMLVWQVDICQGLTAEQCGLVMGGGGAMWGESVDSSNLEPTVSTHLAPLPVAVGVCVCVCVCV